MHQVRLGAGEEAAHGRFERLIGQSFPACQYRYGFNINSMMIETVQFPEISLETSGLSCRRGGRDVFSGLELLVSGGGALLLKGPNGVGKSSLLLALAGLIHCEGRIGWQAEGGDIEEIGPHLHFSGHQHAIKPELTLGENLVFWAEMLGGDQTRVEPALDEAGLGGLGNFAARNLSAGQTHRLALCRLLIAPRPVWLLDEPSSALDRDGDRWVAGLIGAQVKRGGVVIAATHRDIPLSEDLKVNVLDMEHPA